MSWYLYQRQNRFIDRVLKFPVPKDLVSLQTYYLKVSSVKWLQLSSNKFVL